MSVTKKLANISLEDNHSINTVLSTIPTTSLRSLYLADNRGAEVSLKKTELKKLITPAITSASTKYLVERMTTEQLGAAIAPLKIDHEKKRNNPNSRKVLAKRLTENLMSTGVVEYFEKYGETALLKGIAESLELAPASAKGELIGQIAEHVESQGLRLYLESFTEELLQDVAFDMKLEKDPSAVNSKQVLVECILNNHEVPEKKKKVKVKVSKTKPDLKKGVSYQDVFQHYSVEELHDWCRKTGLKTSGNKPELIRRILAFFDGDKENIMAGDRKAPKRRKSTAPKKTKKAATKTEDAEETPATKKTQPKKVTPPPKEEVVEEEEEAEEEVEEEEVAEEEEGDDLDLDNLDSHTLAELKKYCEEEEIEVKGTKKSDFIAAILAYNEGEEAEEEH